MSFFFLRRGQRSLELFFSVSLSLLSLVSLSFKKWKCFFALLAFAFQKSMNGFYSIDLSSPVFG